MARSVIFYYIYGNDVLVVWTDCASIVSLSIQDKGTAFYFACVTGQVEVVKLLMADHRVDVNKVAVVSIL